MTRLRFYRLLAWGRRLIYSVCSEPENLRREEDVSMDLLRKFWEEEDGMGTVEIVMIIAALMCIALLFKEQISKYATGIMKNVFSVDVDAPSAPAMPED